VRVLSFDSKPIAPDKNGKQEAQATLELKLAAVNTAAATTLMTGFVTDNPTPNKYYVGISPSFGGTLSGNTKHNQSVTLRMKLNRREPAEYTQNTRFTPPKKTTGSVGIATTPPPVAAADPAEEAPAPADKAAAK